MTAQQRLQTQQCLSQPASHERRWPSTVATLSRWREWTQPPPRTPFGEARVGLNRPEAMYARRRRDGSAMHRSFAQEISKTRGRGGRSMQRASRESPRFASSQRPTTSVLLDATVVQQLLRRGSGGSSFWRFVSFGAWWIRETRRFGTLRGRHRLPSLRRFTQTNWFRRGERQKAAVP